MDMIVWSHRGNQELRQVVPLNKNTAYLVSSENRHSRYFRSKIKAELKKRYAASNFTVTRVDFA